MRGTGGNSIAARRENGPLQQEAAEGGGRPASMARVGNRQRRSPEREPRGSRRNPLGNGGGTKERIRARKNKNDRCVDEQDSATRAFAMRVQVRPVQVQGEWLLLELQGLLETSGGEPLASLTLGSFTIKDEKQVSGLLPLFSRAHRRCSPGDHRGRHREPLIAGAAGEDQAVCGP